MSHTHIFHEIPLQRPNTPLLDRIDSPSQLRLLSEAQLPQLAHELRSYLLYSTGKSGGHFGAGLGVVELTIALHFVYNTPDDRIVWDVGHQAYPHKILTGRREQITSIRHKDGLAGFPRRSESPYDTFGVGHSSTSISAALGMAIAAKLQGVKRKAVAVIGDGAMTAGMAFEALNHAADLHSDLLVVLNDNDMSISQNVGGLSNYLAKVLSSKTYNQVRDGGKKVLSNAPPLMELARKTEEHMKGMVAPGTMFEELGFNYIGPVDGHDLEALVTTLENMKELDGPQFLHIVTQKGKGFAPAEKDPIGYHAINKIEPKPNVSIAETENKPAIPKYSNVFGQWLCDMARLDPRLMAITPAMKEGSDLIRFAEEYPGRHFGGASAEQHAVTVAAGLACEGAKPVVAIYSTFLQRAYDQLVHDVAVQDLDVLFAIDRAGLVGEDGPTHSGNYDISFLRCIPGMVIMAPADENETRQMLFTGYQHQGPAAVRYPRGTATGIEIEQDMKALPLGQSRQIREGHKVAFLSFGTLLSEVVQAAEHINATVIDMRFVKPLDEEAIELAASNHDLLVTVEENAIQGGAGSAVNELLAQKGITLPILNLGIPDVYIEHAPQKAQRAECGLDCQGILDAVKTRMEKLNQSFPLQA